MRVVVAPSVKSADEVRDLLTEWSASGLMADFCWVTLEPQLLSRIDLPVQKICGGAVEEMPFSEAIVGAGQPRLVAFYPFAIEEEFIPEFPPLIAAFASKTKVVSAYDSDEYAAPALVLAAQDINQKVPYEVLQPGLVPMIMLAVEDRAHPTEASVLSADPARFVPHAAHGLASVADLWAGGADSGRGLIEKIGMAGSTEIRLARSFTRGLDLGEFVDEISEEVLSMAEGLPNPDRSELDTVDDDREIDRTLSDWVEAFWDVYGDALGAPKYEDRQLQPEKQYELLWDAFKEMGRRLRKFFARLPQILTNLGRSIVEGMALTVFALFGGRRSGMKVIVGGQIVPIEDEEFRESLDPEFLELWERIKATGYPTTPDESKSASDLGAERAWEGLFRSALGLLDGSPPAPFEERVVRLPNASRRLLLDDPWLVAPEPFPPALGLKPSDELRACDPRGRDPMFAIEQPAAVALMSHGSVAAGSTATTPMAAGPSVTASALMPESSGPGEGTEPVTQPAEEAPQAAGPTAGPPSDDELDDLIVLKGADTDAPNEHAAGMADVLGAAAKAADVSDGPAETTGSAGQGVSAESHAAQPAPVSPIPAGGHQVDLTRARRSIMWRVGYRIAEAISRAEAGREALTAEVAAEELQEELSEELIDEGERKALRRVRFRSFLLLLVTIGLVCVPLAFVPGVYRYLLAALVLFVALRLHVASVKRSLVVANPTDPDDLAAAWALELSEMILSIRRLAIAFTLLAAAVIYVVVRFVQLEVPQKALIIAAVLLLWMFALARSFLEMIMRRQGINRRYAQMVLDKWNRRSRWALEAGAARRLERRYREYLDWAEASAWLAHHPFLRSGVKTSNPIKPIQVESSPSSMEFRGARTSRQRMVFGEAIRANLFRPGWLRMIGDSVESQVSGRIGQQTPGADTNVFGDIGASANGPRRLFLQALREGTGRTLRDVPQTSVLFGAIGDKTIDEWVDACPSILDPIEPFAGLSDLASNARWATVWVTSWIGGRRTVTAGVVVGEDLVLTCRHPLGSPDRIEVANHGGEVRTGAIGAMCEGADLATIVVPGLGLPAARIADAAPTPGSADDRVFGLSQVRGSEQIEGPVMGRVEAVGKTLTLGDVFARDTRMTPVIEARLERDAGPPGMPIFDAAGSVVGLQSDASKVRPLDSAGSFLRLVVPAGVINHFLSSPSVPIDNGLAFDRQEPAQDVDGGEAPGEFLGRLVDVPDRNRFMRPEHWRAADESQGRIVEIWPETLEWPIEVSAAVSESIDFGRRVRLVLHRVELTQPLRWDELALIADPPGGGPTGSSTPGGSLTDGFGPGERATAEDDEELM